MCLKGRLLQRKKAKQRWSSICWLTPQMAAMGSTELIQSRSQGLPLSPSVGCRVPRTGHPPLLSKAINRELDWKQSSQNMKQHPFGMPVAKVGGGGEGGLACCATMLAPTLKQFLRSSSIIHAFLKFTIYHLVH